MNCVFILFNGNDDLPQVGYRHIHWAHHGTSAGRKFLGTTDDLFVRNDVPLVEEARDLLVENVHDELTEDETGKHKFGSEEMSLLAPSGALIAIPT